MVMTVVVMVATTVAAVIRVRRAVIAVAFPRVVVAVGAAVIAAASSVIIPGRPDSGVAAAHRSKRQRSRDQKRRRASQSCEDGLDSRLQHGVPPAVDV